MRGSSIYEKKEKELLKERGHVKSCKKLKHIMELKEKDVFFNLLRNCT